MPSANGFGLCGAQRVGKTTLARDLSAAAGMPLVETSASGTFARLGLDPKKNYPFGQRLEIQSHILEDMWAVYEAAPPVFVADRTPIDVWAYTIADVLRADVGYEKQVMRFRRDCLNLTEEFFSDIIVIQPGIPIVEAEGKAPGNLAHMEHINAICIGTIFSEEFRFSGMVLERHTTDRDQRLAVLLRQNLSEADLLSSRMLQSRSLLT